MKKKKENFIKELFEDEKQSKNANVKTYMFMKNSKIINVSDKRLEEIHKCGNIVKYAIDIEEKKKKLLYTETCNSRFCSRCQKMNSIQIGQKIFTITNYLKQEKDYNFIFITLTVPNVKGENLKDELKNINKAIDRLMQRKAYNKDVIKAFITKLEITYNRKRNDFHPHIHLLAAVDKDYFKKSNKNYIKRDNLLKDWQECKKDDSISQVDIRAINSTDDDKLMKSILEISKYESKSSDYTLNQEVFEVYYNALKGAQMMRYNREYKELALVFDNDKYGIFHDYRLEVDEYGHFKTKVIGFWNFKNKDYIQYFENLTPEEINFLNREVDYVSYTLFLKKKNKVHLEMLDNKATYEEFEEKFKIQKSKRGTRKTTLENTENKIKMYKNRYKRNKALYQTYCYIDDNFKDDFIKKK